MSEEYIKKSDAIAGFESWKSEKNSAEENFFLCGAKEVIQSIPAADVEPVVRAKWEREFKEVPVKDGSRCVMKALYKCAGEYGCKEYSIINSKRCPNCGAHMDERSDA